MKIHIIILHYGSVQDTKKCLASVRRIDTGKEKPCVMVVDNGTGDLQIKSNKYLRLIGNKKNLGYAAGINIGIKEALKDRLCKYILILNNDTVLPADFFRKILPPLYDVTGPIVMFRWKGNNKYDFGGKINFITGRTTHPASTLRNENKFSGNKIDYISGCCMFVKRQVFDTVGLFDERFFFYFEDVDFCTRAKRAGFSVGVNTKVYIEHKLSASIGKWSEKAIKYSLYSNLLFINKHMGLERVIAWSYLLLLTVKIFINRYIMHKR